MPITMPVPEEYAKKFDAKQPVDVRPVRRLHRPVHGQERPQDRQGDRLRCRASRSTSSATRTGTSRPTTVPPTSTRSTSRRATTTWRRAARRALNGSDADLLRRRRAAGAGAQAGRRSSYKDQLIFVPAGGTRYIALNTTIKPFDNVNVRKAVIASSNRNALRLTRGGAVARRHRHRLHPAGHPRLRGGRRPEAERPTSTSSRTRRATRRSPRSTCWPRSSRTELPIDATASTTGTEKVLTIATNADPGKKTAEVFQGQMRAARLQAELPHRAPGHAVHEVLRRAQGEGRHLPERRVGSRTSSTRSPCSTPTFNGKNILPAGQRQLAAAQRTRRSTTR